MWVTYLLIYQIVLPLLDAWSSTWTQEDILTGRPTMLPGLTSAGAPAPLALQPTPAALRPAVAPAVQLGFTALYTALYAMLFLAVYAQLWLLLLSRHKRLSFQSVFLFLCLLWAALRTTLFSFYFLNSLEANRLPMAVYWLFYCCPVCLQFFTLSLINTYFTQVRPERGEAEEPTAAGFLRQTRLRSLIMFMKTA